MTSSTLNVAYVVLGFVYGILDPVLVYWAALACCVVTVFFYLRATAVYALVLARVIFMAAVSAIVVRATAVPTDPLRCSVLQCGRTLGISSSGLRRQNLGLYGPSS
jgi:hypothetical protein